METNQANYKRRASDVIGDDETDVGAQRAWREDVRMATLTSWHLDKKVPLALIASLVFQTGAFIWWASSMDSRVKSVETQISASAWQAEKIIRIDERLSSMQTNIADIKDIVTRRADAGPR